MVFISPSVSLSLNWAVYKTLRILPLKVRIRTSQDTMGILVSKTLERITVSFLGP